MTEQSISTHQFRFISGLPRSGSTMLAAILRQNPRFHAGMSSPVANLFEGIIAQVSAGSELSSMVDSEQRARILKGLFHSYYAGVDNDVIFDTNRSWSTKLSALIQLFPNAKIICTVRDVAWIMDSLERQYRSNPFENTALWNSPAERSTVFTRVEALAGANRLVGHAWHSLKEACYADYADRLLLLDYDLIVSRPKDVLGLIYQFLDEPEFDHDFDNVDYDAPVFDAQLGTAGLHKVHRKVEPRPRKSILPPDLYQKYSQLSFWRNLPDSKAVSVVAKQADDDQSQPTMPAPTYNVNTSDTKN
jgi:sulfotransferase